MSADVDPQTAADVMHFEFRRINRRRRGAVEIYYVRAGVYRDGIRIMFKDPLKRAGYRRGVAR